MGCWTTQLSGGTSQVSNRFWVELVSNRCCLPACLVDAPCTGMQDCRITSLPLVRPHKSFLNGCMTEWVGRGGSTRLSVHQGPLEDLEGGRLDKRGLSHRGSG